MPDLFGGADWKVYQVSEYEWYVARSLDEAIACALANWGGAREDYEELEDAFELSDEAMDTLRFGDFDEDERPVGEPRSFREELRQRIAAGLSEGEFFAGTDA